jgi:hypothetical protein
MNRCFRRLDGEPIHHLDRRGHDPAGDDGRDSFPGFVDGVEARKQRQHGFRPPQQAQRGLRDDSQGAFGSHDDREEIESRRIGHGAAQMHELAVWQDSLDAEHVVHGKAVLEAMRAARVLGDVSPDRADDLARRIGRVVAAER